MRESLEKKKDPSLLAEYLSSRDAPLTRGSGEQAESSEPLSLRLSVS